MTPAVGGAVAALELGEHLDIEKNTHVNKKRDCVLTCR